MGEPYQEERSHHLVTVLSCFSTPTCIAGSILKDDRTTALIYYIKLVRGDGWGKNLYLSIYTVLPEKAMAP